MTDLRAIQERAEVAQATIVADSSGWQIQYAEDIPMLLEALAEAEAKLAAVEEWRQQPYVTYLLGKPGGKGIAGQELDAILGGSE